MTANATAAGTCQASTWEPDGTLISGGKINLRRPMGGGNRNLCPGATLTVVFTATAPPEDGSYTWTPELLAGTAEPFTFTGNPTVIVDGTPPALTINQTPSNPTSSRTAEFVFTASDATQCKLDGASFATCTSPTTYGDLADGSHTFSVKATDAAGNTAEATYAWEVDTTAPTVSINSGPPALTNSRSATFTFTASEPTQCKLDDGAFEDCTSPKAYSELADGTHTVTVKASDGVGNSSQDSHTWSVDATPPALAITAAPLAVTNSRAASFSFTASEPTECKLDGGAFAGCTSPKSYSDLGDGTHTFTVRASDTAGNTSEASHTWTVDATAPTLSINASPPPLTNSRSASFTFTSNAPTQCKLDDGAFEDCTSPKAYSELADGAHTFTVRAIDTAGNTSLATRTWTVDATAPTLAITGAPPALTNSRSASFSFTASEATQCKLDGGAFAGCTSPRNYSDLGDGTHTFTVRATDAASNTTEASHTWTVDATPPALSISASPPVLTNSRSASFTFTSNAPTQCKLDDGAFEDCTSPKAYSGLADGSHTFTVRALDAAANSTLASRTWTVDGTPPILEITGDKPGNPTNAKTARFTFTTNEPAATQCKLDLAAFSACTSPKDYSSLVDGQHTFSVRATDPAGNSAESAYTWTIDSLAPTVTIMSGPLAATKSRSASFSFAAVDPTQCKLDGAAFTPCTGQVSYSDLPDGSHTFTVKATDAAGNTGQDLYQWTVDNVSPVVTIVQKPTNPSDVKSPTFAFSVNEGGVRECKLDAAAFSPCSSPKGYTDLPDGDHVFTVRSTDAAGNTGEASYAWRLETKLAVAALVGTPPNPSTSTFARFDFTSRAGAAFECSLDGGAFAACTSPKDYSGLAQGGHTFAVRAKDGAGIGPAATYAWAIDSVGPAAAIGQGPGNPTNSRSATFAFSANEASSFACELDGGGFGPCASPWSYQGLGDGVHTFTVRPTDALGNAGSAVSYSWRVDGTPPETTLGSAPATRTTAAAATFTFSASEQATFQCKLDAGAFAACTSPKVHTGLTRTSHSFEVRAVDAAGNIDPTPAIHRWTVTPAVVRTRKAVSALLAPAAGARVTRPPLLRWRRTARASYYNVQLYRGSVKILSAWPTATRLQLKARWRYLGRTRRLTAGTYRWIVWPGFGKPAQGRYGKSLGGRTFRVVSRGR